MRLTAIYSTELCGLAIEKNGLPRLRGQVAPCNDEKGGSLIVRGIENSDGAN